MKLLFLTHPYPNYVPDLLLHGLRKTLGPDAVDYPRKECLYNGVLGLGVCPPNQLCPGWFPDDTNQVDRDDISVKIQKGYFAYIVSDVRAVGQYIPQLQRSPTPLVIIDGEDRPYPVKPGRYAVCRRETDGSDYSIPLPMALPEEIFNWITAYDVLPKRYAIGFLGSTQDDKRKALVETLAKFYPDSLFSASGVPSETNPFPAGRYGRDEYYRELQQCRFVLSLAGAGYDTFRFWENAACNAVHLAARMPIFIPHDFENGCSIIRFENLDELRRTIDGRLNGSPQAGEIICNGRLNLVNHHFTQHRARYFLDRVSSALQ